MLVGVKYNPSTPAQKTMGSLAAGLFKIHLHGDHVIVGVRARHRVQLQQGIFEELWSTIVLESRMAGSKR